LAQLALNDESMQDEITAYKQAMNVDDEEKKQYVLKCHKLDKDIK
jgi:hypothetical protein